VVGSFVVFVRGGFNDVGSLLLGLRVILSTCLSIFGLGFGTVEIGGKEGEEGAVINWGLSVSCGSSAFWKITAPVIWESNLFIVGIKSWLFWESGIVFSRREKVKSFAWESIVFIFVLKSKILSGLFSLFARNLRIETVLLLYCIIFFVSSTSSGLWTISPRISSTTLFLVTVNFLELRVKSTFPEATIIFLFENSKDVPLTAATALGEVTV